MKTIKKTLINKSLSTVNSPTPLSNRYEITTENDISKASPKIKKALLT